MGYTEDKRGLGIGLQAWVCSKRERGGIGRGKRDRMREKEEGMCGTERVGVGVGVGVDGGDERVGFMLFEVKGRKCFLF